MWEHGSAGRAFRVGAQRLGRSVAQVGREIGQRDGASSTEVRGVRAVVDHSVCDDVVTDVLVLLSDPNSAAVVVRISGDRVEEARRERRTLCDAGHRPALGVPERVSQLAVRAVPDEVSGVGVAECAGDLHGFAHLEGGDELEFLQSPGHVDEEGLKSVGLELDRGILLVHVLENGLPDVGELVN